MISGARVRWAHRTRIQSSYSNASERLGVSSHVRAGKVGVTCIGDVTCRGDDLGPVGSHGRPCDRPCNRPCADVVRHRDEPLDEDRDPSELDRHVRKHTGWPASCLRPTSATQARVSGACCPHPAPREPDGDREVSRFVPLLFTARWLTCLSLLALDLESEPMQTFLKRTP